MFDIRPVAYVIGLLVACLGVSMLLPMLVDIAEGRGEWPVYLQSAILSMLAGGLVAVACANAVREGLSIQQTFLLTTGVWVAVPVFGALPFMLGATQSSFTDAFFEAMSGVTTTGSTVLVGLDDLPKSLLLWRGMLQWFGGVGIVVVVVIFLPTMRVGGMQFFRSEGFDTLGKVLPRALDISRGLFEVYIALTMLAALTYLMLGMDIFDATVHALTSMSTGGFSTSDQSFGKFAGPAEYAAVFFMIAASVPFVRLLQVMRGDPLPLWRDEQVRVYLASMTGAVLLVSLAIVAWQGTYSAEVFRHVLFNVVSIFSGTGYGSTDVTLWGPAAFVVLFVAGAIGGCTGSTGCSLKVFRYQVLFASIRTQIGRIRHPHRVNPIRLSGKLVSDDVISSVIALFTMYVLSFGLLTVALALVGLTFTEALTAAWTAIFNIGPAFGPSVGPTGALDAFPWAAKWLMIFGMLIGRLEIVAVLVLFTVRFWRV